MCGGLHVWWPACVVRQVSCIQLHGGSSSLACMCGGLHVWWHACVVACMCGGLHVWSDRSHASSFMVALAPWPACVVACMCGGLHVWSDRSHASSFMVALAPWPVWSAYPPLLLNTFSKTDTELVHSVRSLTSSFIPTLAPLIVPFSPRQPAASRTLHPLLSQKPALPVTSCTYFLHLLPALTSCTYFLLLPYLVCALLSCWLCTS